MNPDLSGSRSVILAMDKSMMDMMASQGEAGGNHKILSPIFRVSSRTSRELLSNRTLIRQAQKKESR